MEITHYFVVRLAQSAEGEVVACVCEEKLTAFAAVSCARAFAKDGRGAIAFSQRCDEALHGCEPRQVIAGFGQMPESVETFLQRLELGRG